MLISVSKYFPPLTQGRIGVMDRFCSVMMTIVDCMITIAAIGILCVFIYLRELTFAYYSALVLSASFLIAQMLCNKWLRQKRIAILTLRLSLYLSAVAVTSIIERSVGKGSLLVLFFAIMSIRELAEIRWRLRRPRILPTTPGCGPDAGAAN